jgi:N4-gp56 family major capsid protein
MANAYTDILSGTSLGLNLVKAAVDRLVEFTLRSQPQFRAVVDKRPVNQNMPGSSVVFNLYQDLSPAVGTLAETTDPDSVAIPVTTQVTVTLNEYGNPVLATRKLRLLSLSDVDMGIADIVAFNMLDSLDQLVRDVARAGTNVERENNALTVFNAGNVNLVRSTDIFQSKHVRYAVGKLRVAKSLPRVDGNYVAYIHPDCSIDLRAATTGADWRTPHAYSAAGNIWGGVIGTYEGATFIETPRVFSAVNGFNPGVTAATTYQTLFFGRQAIAEAVAEEPSVIIGPVVDKMMRFRPVSWYGLLGWSIYRQESIYRAETSSSISPPQA